MVGGGKKEQTTVCVRPFAKMRVVVPTRILANAAACSRIRQNAALGSSFRWHGPLARVMMKSASKAQTAI
jgi:hypothetical protein